LSTEPVARSPAVSGESVRRASISTVVTSLSAGFIWDATKRFQISW
jgi:hypothetical protein